jgi:general stress protein YciG
MAGTKEGALKAKKKILAKNPNHYKQIGTKGGKGSNNGGFASYVVGDDGLTGRERSRIAGTKGGKISRRKSTKVK